MSRVIVKPGNVFSIQLEDGRFCYAQALESPEFAFFDIATDKEISAEEAVGNPVMFRLWVHKSAYRNWNKLGKLSIDSKLTKQIPRFKQNPLNGKLSRYINSQESPATYDEVLGFECAAVWEGPHILSRISDHFAGKENIWVASMQPKKQG